MQDSSLVGTWQLLSFHFSTSDGRITYPWGRDVTGYISYTPQGRMSVIFTKADRAKHSLEDFLGGTAGEKVEAYDGCIAYAGSYEVEGDRVIHHVEASLFPN